MASCKLVTFLIYLVMLSAVRSGHVPNIPNGGRAQYFYVLNDGGYKYGYDTGDGSHALQRASSDNQVEGSYGFNAGGEQINLKYTSGVQGFVPDAQSLEQLQAAAARSAPLHQHSSSGSHHQHDHAAHYGSAVLVKSAGDSDDESSGDSSYQFSYDADTHNRREQSDSTGNVRGRYAYSDDAGSHDLEYVSGPQGFMVVGGSLSEPNGLVGKSLSGPASKSWTAPASSSTGWVEQPSTGAVTLKSGTNGANDDASYNFEYSVGDSSRHESGDSAGNVKGRYSYTNELGTHDLSYIAGADTGFVATGGSLATANGLSAEANARSAASHGSWQSADVAHSNSAGSWQGVGVARSGSAGGSWESNGADDNGDASYSFSYDADTHNRQESSDSAGQVKGRYSYTDEAGNHDLSFVAGPETGFQVTGGSLAQPLGEDVLRKFAKSSTSGQWSTGGNQWSSSGAPQVKSQTGQWSASTKTVGDHVGAQPLARTVSFNLGDTVATKFLPVEGNPKFGYFYESSH